jgi:glycosyltransferase involved in cell wall biosynthesis
VPASDPKATADALIFMLRDAPLRARMADAMRRRVESYYSKPRIDRLYSELYASLFETRA